MNETSMITKVNELHGVNTEEMNIFNLHKLFIDGVAVAYIRTYGEIIQVLTFAKYACNIGATYRMNLKQFNEMVDNFRDYQRISMPR